MHVVSRIVELAAFQSPADGLLPGSSFSTVVRVDPAILRERGGEAAEVHGISSEEIAEGPSFDANILFTHGLRLNLLLINRPLTNRRLINRLCVSRFTIRLLLGIRTFWNFIA